LDLSLTPLTGEALVSIANLSTLENLDLFGCSFVLDEGFQHITSLESLSRLSIHGTGVSEKSLENIKALPALRILTVNSHTFTVADATDVKKAIPGCQVYRVKALEYDPLTGEPRLLPTEEDAERPDTYAAMSPGLFVARLGYLSAVGGTLASVLIVPFLPFLIRVRADLRALQALATLTALPYYASRWGAVIARGLFTEYGLWFVLAMLAILGILGLAFGFDRLAQVMSF